MSARAAAAASPPTTTTATTKDVNAAGHIVRMDLAYTWLLMNAVVACKHNDTRA